MRRINYIYFLIFIIIILILVQYFPYGITKYKKANIYIPRMSITKNETKNSIILLSFRSDKDLKKDINNILKRYKKINSNYYDKKNNICIKKYKLKSGFFMNEITIKYSKNKCVN